jgi:AcrR family transcriptional regulator
VATLPKHLSKTPVGRERLPRAVMEAHQRDRVIDASITVFAKRGYQGTTVDHIVAAAKIGVGSFYALFDGKLDCLLQAYDRTLGEARKEIAVAIPPEAAWPEQVCAALTSLLAWIAANPFPARLVLVEIQTAGPLALSRYEEALEAVTAPLSRGRGNSPHAAELPPTLEAAIVGGVAWLLQQRIVTGEAKAIEALFPELVEIVIEPYLGEDETARLLTLRAAPAAAGTAS